MKGDALVIQGNALDLPLEDESVDLIITSPPYFALRSYRDEGEHYEGQIGSEETPQQFLEALWAATKEMWRVLKPSGSVFVNLGDKRAGSGGHNNNGLGKSTLNHGRGGAGYEAAVNGPVGSKATRRNAPDRYNQARFGRVKSRMMLPERYAIGCEDGFADPCTLTHLHFDWLPAGWGVQQDHWGEWHLDRCRGMGWIVRQVIIWSKPNGLPESVTDRPRDNFEYWYMLTKSERYFSAVDEIREPQDSQYGPKHSGNQRAHSDGKEVSSRSDGVGRAQTYIVAGVREYNPLGKLPGSVWSIPSEPLKVPDHLPQHFACVDEETEILTKRGWLTHDQLEARDEVGGYDLDRGVAHWTTCYGVHRYGFDGDLVAVEKRDLSMRLTPNHRSIVRRPNSAFPLTDEVVGASDLGPRHAIPRSAEWDGWASKSIGRDLAAVCGWVAAEGWYTNTGQVRISQSLTANPEKVEALDTLILGLPMYLADHTGRIKYRRVLDSMKRTERTRTYNGREWTDVMWALPLGLSQELIRLMPKKRLGTWVLDLPDEERRALLEAFVDGDGHRRPDGRIGIFQKERHNLDVLQAIAVMLGYKTTLRRGTGKWILYLTKGGRAITLRGPNGVNEPIPREHYKGIVWCPTTGTGTFIARRNGSVFITGNSFPQEFPRRLILGFSPNGVCMSCGEGRRPVVDANRSLVDVSRTEQIMTGYAEGTGRSNHGKQGSTLANEADKIIRSITGYACADGCTGGETRPAVVLDPFSGTGTVPGVARALGRIGIGVDLSFDYCALATWRIFQSGHFSKTVGRTAKERQTTLL